MNKDERHELQVAKLIALFTEEIAKYRTRANAEQIVSCVVAEAAKVGNDDVSDLA